MKLISTFMYLGLVVMTVTACLSPAASASDPLVFAQMLQAGQATQSDKEELKIAALEGLLSAPSERALPLVRKVLDGDSSSSVKRKALFVLGQNERPEAQSLLLEYAKRPGDLQIEAIRMVGIGGVTESLKELGSLYANAGEDLREAVLQAYLIADDAASVYRLAEAAKTDEEFDAAIRTLGAMDATDELRLLVDKAGDRESLLQAYAVAGDLQSLIKIARESENPRQRQTAISSIGIVGTQAAKQELEEIYRTADSDEIRNAALQGMIISDHDQGVLNLFRQSQDSDRKRDLLRTLVIMDSDLAIDVIDSTLLGE